MAAKNVGQWHTLRLKFGGIVDGIPTWDTAWTIVLGKKRTSFERGVKAVDVTALEDGREYSQPTYETGKVDFDVLVPGTRTFKDKQGQYVQAEYTESAAGVPDVMIGYVENVSTSSGNDAQMETIRIVQGANGAGN